MNIFSGTIEPLATDSRKYFHPSRSLWEKVPDRKSAWRIKPSYYLWLPATQVAFPVADFQKHFALIVSIRVDPTVSASFIHHRIFSAAMSLLQGTNEYVSC